VLLVAKLVRSQTVVGWAPRPPPPSPPQSRCVSLSHLRKHVHVCRCFLYESSAASMHTRVSLCESVCVCVFVRACVRACVRTPNLGITVSQRLDEAQLEKRAISLIVEDLSHRLFCGLGIEDFDLPQCLYNRHDTHAHTHEAWLAADGPFSDDQQRRTHAPGSSRPTMDREDARGHTHACVPRGNRLRARPTYTGRRPRANDWRPHTGARA